MLLAGSAVPHSTDNWTVPEVAPIPTRPVFGMSRTGFALPPMNTVPCASVNGITRASSHQPLPDRDPVTLVAAVWHNTVPECFSLNIRVAAETAVLKCPRAVILSPSPVSTPE